MGEAGLNGLRVLIVEDESLVAMLIEDAIADHNGTVAAVASTLGQALEKASTIDFDVAILDVNLNGAPSFAVADLLIQRRIPLVFSTGYGAAGIPEAWRSAPVLAKPFRESEVRLALEAAMKAQAPGSREDSAD